MMQEWSIIIDGRLAGQKYVPVLIPPSILALWSSTQRFHQPRAPLHNVGVLRTRDG